MQSSGPGRVSVVIPLYNHSRYIRQAIDSVLSQGSLLRELIVVDDGSTDDGAMAVQAMAAADPRIIFWSQANSGAHSAINAGIARARGEFVAFLNSDDAFLPGRLASLTGALDIDPGSDMVASSIAFIDQRGSAIDNPWHTSALDAFKSGGDIGLALMNANFLMTTSNFLVRRGLFDTIGMFSPLRYSHDLDFALRIVASGHRIAFVDLKLLNYRFHPDNTIKENHHLVRIEWAIVAAFFLFSISRLPTASSRTWRRALAATAFLEQHSLARAVQLCLLYFIRHPARTLEDSPVLSDGAFRQVLAESVA